MFLDFELAFLITTVVQIFATRGDVDLLNFLALYRSHGSSLFIIFLITVYFGSFTLSIRLSGQTLRKILPESLHG